uniref:Uncharacterized protein n=1 Tax=Ditylenchus dipsaci TaxID=166011 RepID=A0A915DE38_9BILA
MAILGIIGVLSTFYCEVSPKRRLEEQFARLRDHKLRDPICHLKGRMLGVKTQDWKDYFSMPAQMLSKKKEEKKSGSKKVTKPVSSETKE